MSQTLSAFSKEINKHTDLAKSNLISDLFYEYVKANNMTFRDAVEESRAKRFFWLGYMMSLKIEVKSETQQPN
jgi:hypothetical protein